MKILIFNARHFEREFFEAHNHLQLSLHFTDKPLNRESIKMAKGFDVVCSFVTDDLGAENLEILKSYGVQLIALRSAGYDHVNINAAKKLQLPVVHVPGYSPNAIAEFAVGMILMLSRKILQSHDQVKRHNFSLEKMLGFNLQGKTIGIIGTGQIGTAFAKIMQGFDSKLIAYDPNENETCRQLKVKYTTKEMLFKTADVISLHCPLNDMTKYIINDHAIKAMKPGVLIVNTGRGALINTKAAIAALKSGKMSGLGLDVYENEKALFFKDHSNDKLNDTLYLELESFENVLITGHQAYLSEEALLNIVKTTLDNIEAFSKGKLSNAV